MIDIIRCEPFPKQLVNELKKYKKIIILDEQFMSSSLYSVIGEINLIHNLNLKTIGFFLKDKYIFDNGGRESLLDKYGLNSQKIINTLKKIKIRKNIILFCHGKKFYLMLMIIFWFFKLIIPNHDGKKFAFF